MKDSPGPSLDLGELEFSDAFDPQRPDGLATTQPVGADPNVPNTSTRPAGRDKDPIDPSGGIGDVAATTTAITTGTGAGAGCASCTEAPSKTQEAAQAVNASATDRVSSTGDGAQVTPAASVTVEASPTETFLGIGIVLGAVYWFFFQ